MKRHLVVERVASQLTEMFNLSRSIKNILDMKNLVVEEAELIHINRKDGYIAPDGTRVVLNKPTTSQQNLAATFGLKRPATVIVPADPNNFEIHHSVVNIEMSGMHDGFVRSVTHHKENGEIVHLHPDDQGGQFTLNVSKKAKNAWLKHPKFKGAEIFEDPPEITK